MNLSYIGDAFGASLMHLLCICHRFMHTSAMHSGICFRFTMPVSSKRPLWIVVCMHSPIWYACSMQLRLCCCCNAYSMHLLFICCAFIYASMMHACICCAVVMRSVMHLQWICCASTMHPCMHLSCIHVSVKHMLSISVAFCHAPDMHLLCVCRDLLGINAHISCALIIMTHVSVMNLVCIGNAFGVSLMQLLWIWYRFMCTSVLCSCFCFTLIMLVSGMHPLCIHVCIRYAFTHCYECSMQPFLYCIFFAFLCICCAFVYASMMHARICWAIVCTSLKHNTFQ